MSPFKKQRTVRSDRNACYTSSFENLPEDVKGKIAEYAPIRPDISKNLRKKETNKSWYFQKVIVMSNINEEVLKNWSEINGLNINGLKIKVYTLSINNKKDWNMFRKYKHVFTDLRHLLLDGEYDEFDSAIYQGELPNTIKQLTFGYKYSGYICDDALPKNLTRLELGRYFNQKIRSKHMLPENLKQLIFGDNFNQPICAGVLPVKLTYLKFGYNFDQPIGKDMLPDSLTEIIFGDTFNRDIGEGVLPRNLKKLTFGRIFNRSIGKDVLPKGLEMLEFGTLFNKEISVGVLPEKLIKLSFGDKFNKQMIKNVLPNSLKQLAFGSEFNWSIDNVLPTGLKTLELGRKFNQSVRVLIGNTPDLAVLDCDSCMRSYYDEIPPHLKENEENEENEEKLVELMKSRNNRR
jgi:hypothetical protein